jgi:hypothetical protein
MNDCEQGTAPMCFSDAMFWFGVSGGCLILSTVSGYCSVRPRSYVRFFVPRDEWRGAVQSFIRDPKFRHDMRFFSHIQLGLVLFFSSVGLWLWLANR